MKLFADFIRSVDFNILDLTVNNNPIFVDSISDFWNNYKDGFQLLFQRLQYISEHAFYPKTKYKTAGLLITKEYDGHDIPYYEIVVKDENNVIITDIFDIDCTDHNWLSLPVNISSYNHVPETTIAVLFEMSFYGFDEDERMKNINELLK